MSHRRRSGLGKRSVNLTANGPSIAMWIVVGLMSSANIEPVTAYLYLWYIDKPSKSRSVITVNENRDSKSRSNWATETVSLYHRSIPCHRTNNRGLTCCNNWSDVVRDCLHDFGNPTIGEVEKHIDRFRSIVKVPWIVLGSCSCFCCCCWVSIRDRSIRGRDISTSPKRIYSDSAGRLKGL